MKKYYIIKLREPEYYFIKIGKNTLDVDSVHYTTKISEAQSWEKLEQAEIVLEQVHKMYTSPACGIIKK
jgi:hypothetical protein